MQRLHRNFFTLAVLALNTAIIITGLLLYERGPFVVTANIVESTINIEDITRFEVLSGTPTRITIDSLGINLAVKPGLYDPATELWSIDGQNAFFATPTKEVNNSSGQSLIYGHNIPAVFSKLHNLQAGASMTVQTTDGSTYVYEYKQATEVEPRDGTVFSNTGKAYVVLQTCSGDWNEYRRLFSFRLISWEKA